MIAFHSISTPNDRPSKRARARERREKRAGKTLETRKREHAQRKPPSLKAAHRQTPMTLTHEQYREASAGHAHGLNHEGKVAGHWRRNPKHQGHDRKSHRCAAFRSGTGNHRPEDHGDGHVPGQNEGKGRFAEAANEGYCHLKTGNSSKAVES